MASGRAKRLLVPERDKLLDEIEGLLREIETFDARQKRGRMPVTLPKSFTYSINGRAKYALEALWSARKKVPSQLSLVLLVILGFTFILGGMVPLLFSQNDLVGAVTAQPAPPQLHALTDTGGELIMRWSSNPSAYVVQVSKDDAFRELVFSVKTSDTGYSLPLGSLAADTLYFVRVSNDDGWSEPKSYLVESDECKSVTCDTPPSNCYDVVGTCNQGKCEYDPLPDGASCSDGKSCTEGDICDENHVCRGSISCPDICNGETLQTQGTCSVDGTCQYVEKTCVYGCQDAQTCILPPEHVTSSSSSGSPSGTPSGASAPPDTPELPPPVPTPVWNIEYFGNKQLQGDPVATRIANEINFDWGEQGPGFAQDDFSARFARKETFEDASYSFSITGDDGFRVFIDGQIVPELTSWSEGSRRTLTFTRKMGAGDHDMVVEYFESKLFAVLVFNYVNVGDVPPPVASCGGSVQLAFNPGSVAAGASSKPTVSGLSSCNGKTTYIKQGSCSGTSKGSCVVSGSGCVSSSFNSVSSSASTQYFACVDKNADGDFVDSGESGSAWLTTTAPSQPPPPVASCGGSVQLAFNPGSVAAGASSKPTVSGLSSCNGKTAYIKQGSCTGTSKGSCVVSGSGCVSSSFNSVSSSASTQYFACVDKNADGDFVDSGESGSAWLTTSAPPPPASCSGFVQLAFNPSSVTTGASSKPTVSGLSSCNGKTVYVKQGSCTGSTKGSCSVSGSGCVSSSFNSVSSSASTQYFACVDKNADGDFVDSGESGSAWLTTTAPPPPASGVAANNVLKNPDFSSGTTSWSVYQGFLSASNGIARLNIESGSINHFGQTLGTSVSPGQTIHMLAKVRAGSRLFSNSNTGCGIGIDFREYQTGKTALIGTLNGPATTSQNWVLIKQDFTIPWRNSPDTSLPTSSYSVTDFASGAVLQSTTYQGSRFGRSSNSDNGISDPTNLPLYYQSHDYPSKMSLLEWNHNWFNTMQYCEFDWVSLTVS